MIDRKKFFDNIRPSPFGGSMSVAQVEGVSKILDEWERRNPRG
jgi:putative chitinase